MREEGVREKGEEGWRGERKGWRVERISEGGSMKSYGRGGQQKDEVGRYTAS